MCGQWDARVWLFSISCMWPQLTSESHHLIDVLAPYAVTNLFGCKLVLPGQVSPQSSWVINWFRDARISETLPFTLPRIRGKISETICWLPPCYYTLQACWPNGASTQSHGFFSEYAHLASSALLQPCARSARLLTYEVPIKSSSSIQPSRAEYPLDWKFICLSWCIGEEITITKLLPFIDSLCSE